MKKSIYWGSVIWIHFQVIRLSWVQISFSVCCNALGKNKEVMRCCCYLVPLFLGTPFAAECSGECPGNCWVFVVFLLLLWCFSIHEVQSICIAVISASDSTQETEAEKRGMNCTLGDNVNAEIQFALVPSFFLPSELFLSSPPPVEQD